MQTLKMEESNKKIHEADDGGGGGGGGGGGDDEDDDDVDELSAFSEMCQMKGDHN
jgi:hypothetical protein